MTDDDDLAQTAAPTIDGARFRQVMGHFCTGVTVVAAVADGQPVGLTLQSFTSLSLDPPLVSVAVGRGSSTWPVIRETGSFVVNVLSDEQEAVARRFATSGLDKFQGVGWVPSPSGAPILNDVLAWVDCRIEGEHEAGDHVLVVARVLDLGVGGEGGPLLFYRGGFGRFEP